MSVLLVVVVTSLWCGLGVKPERQTVAGAKSSVFGIGIEAHGVSGGTARVDLRCSISNSCEGAVAVWVVESRYFGEARAMSLCGDVEDGTRPLIMQTEGVGSFRRQGRSTGRQFRRRPGNWMWGAPWESIFWMTHVVPTARSVGLLGIGVMSWTVSRGPYCCWAYYWWRYRMQDVYIRDWNLQWGRVLGSESQVLCRQRGAGLCSDILVCAGQVADTGPRTF